MGEELGTYSTEQAGNEMSIVALIPAYNEEEHVDSVIHVLQDMDLFNRIIVIDDGSEDRTSEVARNAGADVIRLDKNCGKAAAMDFGVRSTDEPVILFLDADLTSLKTKHVQQLLNPVLENEADMTMGVFKKGRFRTDIAHTISPGLSGQRAMLRSVWEMLDTKDSFENIGYGIERELQKLVSNGMVRFKKIHWVGVSQVTKEEKLGAQKGLKLRMKMYRDILKSFTRWVRKPEL